MQSLKLLKNGCFLIDSPVECPALISIHALNRANLRLIKC